jgi:hypothetical protein
MVSPLAAVSSRLDTTLSNGDQSGKYLFSIATIVHDVKVRRQYADMPHFTESADLFTDAIKHIKGRGGACSAQSGRGKQRPYIMGCDGMLFFEE